VGAVNCAKEKTLCSEYFAVTSYPMLMMVGSSERGTQQIYSQKGVKDASSLTDWARKVGEEWRWLVNSVFSGRGVAEALSWQVGEEWRWLYSQAVLEQIKSETAFDELVLGRYSIYLLY
jgi:hypothetical protein